MHRVDLAGDPAVDPLHACGVHAAQDHRRPDCRAASRRVLQFERVLIEATGHHPLHPRDPAGADRRKRGVHGEPVGGRPKRRHRRADGRHVHQCAVQRRRPVVEDHRQHHAGLLRPEHPFREPGRLRVEGQARQVALGHDVLQHAGRPEPLCPAAGLHHERSVGGNGATAAQPQPRRGADPRALARIHHQHRPCANVQLKRRAAVVERHRFCPIDLEPPQRCAVAPGRDDVHLRLRQLEPGRQHADPLRRVADARHVAEHGAPQRDKARAGGPVDSRRRDQRQQVSTRVARQNADHLVDSRVAVRQQRQVAGEELPVDQVAGIELHCGVGDGQRHPQSLLVVPQRRQEFTVAHGGDERVHARPVSTGPHERHLERPAGELPRRAPLLGARFRGQDLRQELQPLRHPVSPVRADRPHRQREPHIPDCRQAGIRDGRAVHHPACRARRVDQLAIAPDRQGRPAIADPGGQVRQDQVQPLPSRVHEEVARDGRAGRAGGNSPAADLCSSDPRRAGVIGGQLQRVGACWQVDPPGQPPGRVARRADAAGARRQGHLAVREQRGSTCRHRVFVRARHRHVTSPSTASGSGCYGAGAAA